MIWSSAIILLLVCATLYYVWFILRAYGGLRPPDQNGAGADLPFVTVVIAARNEEGDLPGCLASLSNQDYPAEDLEFIIVDDGSVDRTAEIVREHGAHDGRFKLHQLQKQTVSQPSRKRGRKPEALAAGIAQARGVIIAITDADCRPTREWVRTITSQLRGDVVYAVGPVVERSDGTFFSSMRSLEILGLTGMAGGRIGAGRPLNSLGGNIAFRKDIFLRTGGFDYAAVKSDEETMMHRIIDDGIGQVVFVPLRSARVVTTSPPTMKGFWNQRKRWGSMHGRFRNKGILVELSLLYLALLVPVAGLGSLVVYPSLWAWVAGFFVVKAIIDWRMLRRCADMFGDPISPAVFLVAETFHTFYLIVISAVAQFSRYRWKDRTVLTIETARTEP